MFTGMCLSTGGMPGPVGVPGLGGACSGGVCLVRGCLVWGVPAPGGCLLQGGVPGGEPPNGHCCGRYASYWNAFLLGEEIQLQKPCAASVND